VKLTEHISDTNWPLSLGGWVRIIWAQEFKVRQHETHLKKTSKTK
jgi:hypothetical protein